MKVRVCKYYNQYYIEYRKGFIWWLYQEDNGYGQEDIRYFASKETAINFAIVLSTRNKDKRHKKVVWEST